MNILILTESYPEKDNLYNYAFIHTRAKAYKDFNHNVLVLFLSKGENIHYQHEELNVIKGEYKFWKEKIKEFNPTVIATHSPKNLIFKFIDLIKNDFKIKNYTWIHGIEALSINRRFYDVDNVKDFLKFISIEQLRNIKKLYKMRQYISKANKSDDEFIFVSKWMYKIAKTDTFTKIRNYSIIANPIDTKTFKFNSNRNSNKILIIRSFDSKKYANDISVEILNKLTEKKIKYELSIFGNGKYFNELTSKIKLENKKIFKKHLTHSEMNREFSDFGFFLCPTRQDAQGVTMCEAMSAGLIPITSYNTAIPEFVQNNINGIVENDTDIIVEKIIETITDKELFSNLSLNSSNSMQELSFVKIVQKELELLEKSEI